MTESITYCQFEDGELGFFHEGVEPKQAILMQKTVEHDIEFVDFLRDCPLDEVKKQISFILNN